MATIKDMFSGAEYEVATKQAPSLIGSTCGVCTWYRKAKTIIRVGHVSETLHGRAVLAYQEFKWRKIPQDRRTHTAFTRAQVTANAGIAPADKWESSDWDLATEIERQERRL